MSDRDDDSSDSSGPIYYTSPEDTDSDEDGDDDDNDDEFSPSHDGDDVATWITNGKKKKQQQQEKMQVQKDATKKASSDESGSKQPMDNKKMKTSPTPKRQPLNQRQAPSSSTTKNKTRGDDSEDANNGDDDDDDEVVCLSQLPPLEKAKPTRATTPQVKRKKSTKCTSDTMDDVHSATTTSISTPVKSEAHQQSPRIKAAKRRKISMSPTDTLAKQSQSKKESSITSVEAPPPRPAAEEASKSNENTNNKNKVASGPSKVCPEQLQVEQVSNVPNTNIQTKKGTKSKKTIAKATTATTKKVTTAIASSSTPTSTSTTATKDDKVTKPKKSKKATFQDRLLSHMFLSCMPFNMKDLIGAMGPGTSEASVNFCLLSLVDKKWVIKKTFEGKGGRIKELYWANQECKAKELWEGSLNHLMVPLEEIHQTRRDLGALQQQSKQLDHELARVLQTPSNHDLTKQIEMEERLVIQLEQQLQAMKGRIAAAAAEGAATNPQKRPLLGRAPPAKKKMKTPRTLKKQINGMREAWRKRKQQCLDFCDQLGDGLDKKPKDVIKMLELETDEMVGAVVPPKHVVNG